MTRPRDLAEDGRKDGRLLEGGGWSALATTRRAPLAMADYWDGCGQLRGLLGELAGRVHIEVAMT